LPLYNYLYKKGYVKYKGQADLWYGKSRISNEGLCQIIELEKNLSTDEAARELWLIISSSYQAKNYYVDAGSYDISLEQQRKAFNATVDNLHTGLVVASEAVADCVPGSGVVQAVSGESATGQKLTWQERALAVSPVAIIGAKKAGKAGKVTKLADATDSGVGVVSKETKLLSQPLALADHHIIPAFRGKSFKYAEFIKSRGINVDEFTVSLVHGGTGSQHLKFIHGQGQWNTKWMNWIDENPNATTEDIYNFAGQMMDDFGLSNLPIHPYGKQ